MINGGQFLPHAFPDYGRVLGRHWLGAPSKLRRTVGRGLNAEGDAGTTQRFPPQRSLSGRDEHRIPPGISVGPSANPVLHKHHSVSISGFEWDGLMSVLHEQLWRVCPQAE